MFYKVIYRKILKNTKKSEHNDLKRRFKDDRKKSIMNISVYTKRRMFTTKIFSQKNAGRR